MRYIAVPTFFDRRRRGFGLLDSLVVVAVIGGVTFAFSSYGTVARLRERAKAEARSAAQRAAQRQLNAMCTAITSGEATFAISSDLAPKFLGPVEGHSSSTVVPGCEGVRQNVARVRWRESSAEYGEPWSEVVLTEIVTTARKR